MADYDLGTAHGRIVVDYKDKGTGQAGKDLDSLKLKAAQLLKQFQETTGKYVKGAKQMASEGSSLLGRLRGAHRDLSGSVNQLIDDFDRFTNQFAAVTGALAVGLAVFGKTNNAIVGLKGGVSILSQLRGALGRTPSGAEGFPSVIKKVMQLSAAIGLFASTTRLLSLATARFRGVSAVTGLLARFGGTVDGLAKPLHAVAGIAKVVAFQILQFKFVKAVVKPLLMFGGALGAVGGALHLVAGLAASIKDLTGVVGLLPAVVGAAVFGFAALKIATLGLSDAFKAWDDPAKFAEALKKLHPEAAKAVLAIKSLQGAFKDAQKRLQGRLFDGLSQPIKELGQKFIPILEERFGRVADSTNLAGKAILNYLNSAQGIKQAKTILNNYANIWENLLAALPHVVRALLDITEVGSKVFKDLTGGAEGAAKRFAEFIDKAKQTGDLEKWIRNGVQALKDLWGIVKNVGKALGGIWKGLNGGEAKSFLGTLNELTAKFNAFIQSVEGQRVLGLLGDAFESLWNHAKKLGDAFVTYVLPVLEKFLPIMVQLSGGVIDGVIRAFQILSPIFIAIATALKPIAPLLGIILSGMVTFAVVLIGLGVAAKIVGSAIFLLKSGLDTVKTVMGVAGFATRLLTGNLKAAELQALKFAGAIGKTAVKGLWSFITTSRLIRGLGIVAALAAITVAADNLLPEADQSKLKNSALGSLPDYLNHSRQDLSDYADFVRGILSDPSAELSKQQADIRDEVNQTGQTWRDGKAPIQEWFATVKESFMTDFIGFFQGLPAKIGGWLAGVGESFNTALVQPIVAAAGRVKESFMTDFVGFFTGLPAMIAGWAAGIATSAQTMWQGFVDGARAKFIELGGEVGSLPARIGIAIGALIGIALKWGLDTWESFKQGAITKFNEIVADVAALPGRIGAAVSGMIASARKWAIDTWNSFKQGATEKQGEIEGDVRALPGRIGAAISGLASTLAAKAREAWNNFKTSAMAVINQAIADVRAFPGKAAAAISALASQLAAKAREAWNSFKTSAMAMINQAMADVRAVPGRILSALGNMGSLLVNAGRSVINGLLAGIKAAVQGVYDFVSGIAAGIAARKGPISYDKKLLIPAGNAIIQGLRQGLAQELPALWSMVGGIGDKMTSAMDLSSNFNLRGNAAVTSSSAVVAPAAWAGPVAGSDGATAPVTNNYNVTIPAKDIAEMKSVADFFGKVQQKARAGRAVV